ncbi:ATP-dependent RNA helicase HrpA [Agaribacterium haliotis]|uniref:ATP-dependent RNA helicase HrpA n=1 Tax=Agaribacterium haliotis TaxID=2013869 RepID=UPI000BB532F8|nr:ATP-dependent RNA helicase HrpA [Agaribacterium haliotis]
MSEPKTPPSLQEQQQTYTLCQTTLAELDAQTQARLRKLASFIGKRLKQALPADAKLAQLQREIDAAQQRLLKRMAAIPALIEFPENLPVVARKDEIAEAIEKNQVVVVAGETGSGKTTQLPKVCLELGLASKGLIAHTQPRRIAARTVAARIAEELKSPLGSLVGYQVRFTDHSDEQTAIKLMTDGILLAEIQKDPLLQRYQVIIIDEAHERSLNIDFLLGYLKQLLPKRPDLKVIVTSATIDVERFSEHFNKAPVIEVSGRTYPVELRYSPWQEDAEELSQAVLACTEEILAESRGKGGDILVFLSGERDIREVSLALKKAQLPGLEVLPLYARLSLAEQNRVFQNHKGRRIVLATNVAETSLTVPGIRYVIDTGTARISRYSLRTKVQRLPIEAISQASANQRAGRCGRVSEGICYRLYSEEDFLSRPEFTDAEILRTNLAAVVLQMLHLRMGKVEDFPFVDKPDMRLIKDGYKLLEELKAVDKKGHMTQLGRQFNRLAVDPRFARMILAAAEQGCLNEVLIIVTALTIQDPRERPADKQQAADEKHRRFWHEGSDFLAFVNLWNYVEEQRQELSQNQLRKLCKKEFLNFLRLKEWRELHYQLKLQCKDLGFRINQEPARDDAVHHALLTGLLSNVGKRNLEESERDYLGSRSRKFHIFPGSSLRKKKLPWLMAADFIETTQLYAHCVAKIDPAWVIRSASHLLNRQYFEPHYDVKSGSVKAYMKVSLWGLVLAEKQRVDFSQIEPETCRQVFIRSALVEGRYRGKGEFFKANQALIDELSELEAKARRRDILVDDEQIYQFYEALIPERIVNLKGFEHWRREQEKTDKQRLFLKREQLMLHSADNLGEEQFPASLVNGDLRLAVRYEFEPTRANDGLNVFVPVDLLHQVDELQLEWLVPGMLRDKCIALVKSLPKALRKQLVPVPAFVDRALARMNSGPYALTQALADELRVIAAVDIDAQQWKLDELDDYYKANVVVVDDKDKIIDQSRDVQQLRKQYKATVEHSLRDIGSSIERKDLRNWDFDKLDSSMEIERGRVKVKTYPALLCDSGARSVEIKLFDNPLDANWAHQRGLCQLALNELGETAKYARKNLLKGKDLGLSLVDIGSREQVADDILQAAIKRACFAESASVREKPQFEAALAQGRSELVEIAEQYEKLLLASLAQVLEIRKQLKASKNALALALAFGDIQHQLGEIFYRGFLFDTPWHWLQQLPRYLKAINLRLEKAAQKNQADRAAMYQLQPLWQQHEDRLQREGLAAYSANAAWQDYRWMLEELRVSLFAQSLKTLLPVSEKRLKKQWQESL